MRKMLTGFVVAAIAAIVPTLALAGNQEVAEKIAHKFRHSGQMSDYKIGVKYQDGTAWLFGRVASEEQMNTALRLTFQISSVNRIVNDLTVTGAEAAEPADNESPAANPLRNAAPDDEQTAPQPERPSMAKRLQSVRGGSQQGYADRVASSYSTQVSVRPVADEEPQPMPMSPQARQAAGMPRGESRMATMQPNMRGPVAPNGAPLPMYRAATSQAGVAPARYDQPCMPNYAWPSYASYPNYAAVTYPKQYSPTAWPYIGPFYPYPQVPLGWRKVTLEWDSGWWFLDFKDQPASCWHR
jgi:hypothetical protein